MVDSATNSKPVTPKPENSTPAHGENYWLMILFYFAAFLVGLGIVSLIAANWQQIPNNIKLGGAVFLMLCNTFAIILTMRFNKPILKQVLCVIYAFLIMGVIGLIGQIFNLNSDMNKACLFWALCSWPLFLITPRLLWLWLPMLFTGCYFGCYLFFEDSRPTQDLGLSAAYIRAVVAASVIFAYEIWMLYGKKDKTVERPLRFYCGLILLSPFSALFPYMDKTSFMNMSWPLLSIPCSAYILAAGIIFGLNYKQKRISFMPLFLIGTAVELILARSDVLKHYWYFGYITEMIPMSICNLLALSAYSYYHKMPKLQFLTLFTQVVWLLINFESDIFDIVPSLLICTFIAVTAYLNQSRKMFNTAVILAILRILAYYSDISDLTAFGLYLIGSGLLLILTLVALVKCNQLLWEKKHD